MTDPGVKAQIGERMEKMAIPPAAIARAIAFAIEQPAEVDVNEIVIRPTAQGRSEEHTSELQSQSNLVCRLLLEKKKKPASRLHPAPRRVFVLFDTLSLALGHFGSANAARQPVILHSGVLLLVVCPAGLRVLPAV